MTSQPRKSGAERLKYNILHENSDFKTKDRSLKQQLFSQADVSLSQVCIHTENDSF
jgi:hypothetical protein